jgi:hypothetical protein
MSECPQCGEAIKAGPRRKTYCSVPCQIKAANSRRATTRSGRRSEAPYTPKSGSEKPELPSDLSTPQRALSATIAQLFGAWYVRVNGHLAVGPMMDQLRAQDHADRMNKEVRK